MLRAVIFDFDGVLVDSELLHFQAFNNILAPLHVEMSKQDYYDNYLGLSDEELLRTIDKERKLAPSENQIRQLLKDKAATFKKLASTQATVIAGVPEFIEMLAGNKIPLAVCSGALKPEIEMILKGAGLRHYFDVIISAEQVEKGKPDPEGFLLALKLLNKRMHKSIKPEDCVVIEDSHWGLEAAKAAGMRTVAITNTYAAEHLKPADKVIEHLNDLTLSDLRFLCP